MKGVAVVELQNGHQRRAEFIGMKPTASAGRGSKSNGSSIKRSAAKRHQVAAAVCLKTGGCGDLELRKLYRLLPDKKANAEGYLRVVDESGEDYLYPADYFAVVQVPAAAAQALIS
jgi:hypothetical protein